MDVDVGQIIAGKYELVRLLGKGAMGEVWLATHNSLGGDFAVKLIEPADDEDGEADATAGRFQFEAQVAARLSRKTRHIVSVSDHGEDAGLAYLVMECLEGESLEARIERMGTLDLPEVAAIVLQVERALSLAHEEGVIHRDLKPANVWLGRDEDGRMLVKLLDFGIARSNKRFRTRSPYATSKHMVLGTPGYMSPEQARGLPTLDYRCDLWALAVVAYEGLTGLSPFDGETIEDLFLAICTFRIVPARRRRPDLPPALDAFFARAFAENVEARFASANELAMELETFVSPEELSRALGDPPSSTRRMAVSRGSNPDRESSPSVKGVRGGTVKIAEPELRGGPLHHEHGPAKIAPALSRVGTGTDFERGALSDAVLRPRRTGLLTAGAIAVLALVLVLGVGALAIALRKPIQVVSGQPQLPTTANAPSAGLTKTESAAPPTSVALPAPSAPEPTSTPTTWRSSSPNASKTPPAVKTAVSGSPPVSPPPSALPAQPPVTPPPARSVNKGEVF